MVRRVVVCDRVRQDCCGPKVGVAIAVVQAGRVGDQYRVGPGLKSSIIVMSFVIFD